MDVIFYRNSAPPNKVDKSSNLSGKNTFTNVRFLDDNNLDILNPSVLLNIGSEISEVAKYNYMYIAKFKRYYYIDKISTEGGLVRIDGICDVLMSHKNDILSSKQYIMRQEQKNNSPYLDDNLLPISSNHNYYGKIFGRKVADTTCGRIILATTGNGGTVI